jgi:hypothetical protein
VSQTFKSFLGIHIARGKKGRMKRSDIKGEREVRDRNNDRLDLLSERSPHVDRTATFRKINKYLVISPRWGSSPRQTD